MGVRRERCEATHDCFMKLSGLKVARVAVVDPNLLLVTSHSMKKKDRNDVRNLALHLAKGFLPEVCIKQQAHVEVSSLTQACDRLAGLRAALKNRPNNLFSARGIGLENEGLTWEKRFCRALQLRLQGLAKVELAIIVGEIRTLNRSGRRLETVIEEAAQKPPDYSNLPSIKRIASLGVGVLLSVIGNVKDFSEEGWMASSFVILLRVHTSNETEHPGCVTKRGTNLGRTPRVQCALTSKCYSSQLNRCYEVIVRPRHGRVISEFARESLGFICPALKTRWVFKDFPNFPLAEVKTEPRLLSSRSRQTSPGVMVTI